MANIEFDKIGLIDHSNNGTNPLPDSWKLDASKRTAYLLANLPAPSNTIKNTQANLLDLNKSSVSYLDDGITKVLDVKHFDVKRFGAKGDGSTDDAAAINAASDAAFAAINDANTISVVHFPTGNYLCKSKIKIHSLCRYEGGLRNNVYLVASTDFADNYLGEIQFDTAGNTLCQHTEVINLAFDTSSKATVTGLGASPNSQLALGNSKFHRLRFKGKNNLVIPDNVYCQYNEFSDIFSNDVSSKFFHIKGNFNVIKYLDKEGTCFNDTEPLVCISNNNNDNSTGNGNYLEHILLEGDLGNVNKIPLKLEGYGDITIVNFWVEYPLHPPVKSLDIQNYDSVKLKGVLQLSVASPKIYARAVKLLEIDSYTTDGTDVNWRTHFDMDSTVNLAINNLRSRRNAGYQYLNDTNIFINNSHDRSNRSSDSTFRDIKKHFPIVSKNLIKNGNFTQDLKHWTRNGSGSTIDYPSNAPTGKNFRMSFSGSGVDAIYQNVTITAAMVGYPINVSCIAKHTGGGNSILQVSGCGTSGVTTVNYTDNNVNDWEILTLTLVPSSAGNLTVQLVTFTGVNGTKCEFTGVQAGLGTISIPSFTFPELLLDGKMIQYASSIPTHSGNAGDITYNNAPTSGGFIGWVCITGTTWKTFGVIS